jgi:hypothetical protein
MCVCVYIYIYYLIREARKTVTTIHEGVDEMGRIVANTMLNLWCGGLQEVGEAERLEMTLMKYEIAYHGSDEDASSFTSISGPSTSISGPSTSILGHIGPPHTYMKVTYVSSSWTSWGDALDLFSSALGLSTS